jgi:hypothetical protein
MMRGRTGILGQERNIVSASTPGKTDSSWEIRRSAAISTLAIFTNFMRWEGVYPPEKEGSKGTQGFSSRQSDR